MWGRAKMVIAIIGLVLALIALFAVLGAGSAPAWVLPLAVVCFGVVLVIP